jgi:hypothetical protein
VLQNSPKLNNTPTRTRVGRHDTIEMEGQMTQYKMYYQSKPCYSGPGEHQALTGLRGGGQGGLS